MAAMNLCWIAHSTSNVTWTRLSNLKSFPTFKVMGWHFSTTTHFLSQSASHSTSLDQMQSIQCPSQHTRRHVPHPASARDLTDHQMRSRDPRPQTVVQLYLVIQDVWDDITQARITHLILFMPRRCRVVHEAHGLPQPSLTLLHLTACCTEESATINFNLANDDSRQIVDSTHTNNFRQFSHSHITGNGRTWQHNIDVDIVLYTDAAMSNESNPISGSEDGDEVTACVRVIQLELDSSAWYLTKTASQMRMTKCGQNASTAIDAVVSKGSHGHHNLKKPFSLTYNLAWINDYRLLFRQDWFRPRVITDSDSWNL